MPTNNDPFELHLEYAELVTDYRMLASQPFSCERFEAMQQIVARLDDIRGKLNVERGAVHLAATSALPASIVTH